MQTTAIAMSGGVDSSVAACLLARAGRPLVGFSMQLIDKLAGETERYGRCCSPEDFQDARRVAERMGFPHYVLDLEDAFQRQVLTPFAEDYAAGRTPSPCVRCNTFMKFGSLLGRARAVGAERVATGHYAILEKDPQSGRTLLRRAADSDSRQVDPGFGKGGVPWLLLVFYLSFLCFFTWYVLEFQLPDFLKQGPGQKTEEPAAIAGENPESDSD